ncbi:ABC transporter permease [Streptomyces sp. NBC_00878]|uniref:ABC transporter permease n=1 Tax=Streptomyces sp. NBC_00878 TaxID=2975854 RepID=UPI002258CF1A|nr:FtsX-like permease family protein [Streptomyces sp. NBC_00878]MCX4905752.1 ABC transporter permease [Streptomyces sp. NBC_00878]
MGAKFAFTGGREGWVRVLLTGVGVGLGVALLLLTTAIPSALQTRSDRSHARMGLSFGATEPAKGDNTALVGTVDTEFRDMDIRGRELEPEGLRAPLPPGLKEFPAPGEMVVSPALRTLLESKDGKVLRERLPDRITGTIEEAGLIGSAELSFYAGGENLAKYKAAGGPVSRVDTFRGKAAPAEPLGPILLLLVLMVFVVLLMPVGVFIATAVRFGGERRDRRLAALRLVGADGRMTRRIAAGEALSGALVGLLFGIGFFLIGRQIAGSIEILDVSVFPSYLNPTPALALLIAVAVPAAAVAVTLLALRGVVIEPLGVVRTARPPRRRLWWRLLMPLAGLGLLAPMIGKGNQNGNFNEYMVTGGVVLLLVGITALLPWLVEALVARLNPGSISGQLAVRRLQLSSGTAARMVNGIAVAVAGAIALQMLFTGVEDDFTKATGQDPSRAQMLVELPSYVPLADARRDFTKTRGVREAIAISKGELGETNKDPEMYGGITVGDCAALREVAKLPSCREGDVFAVHGAEEDSSTAELATPGRKLSIDPSYTDSEKGKEVAWTVPRGIKKAQPREDPTGWQQGGFLFTASALPAAAAPALHGQVFLGLDMTVPDIREIVRNTATKIDPFTSPMTLVASEKSRRFESIRTGLFVGAAGVLALIGASLLVSQLEQLRERKKLLAALVAFGTRRRTLSLSVLWQAAIPVGLGLALACVVGLTLGTVLLKMTATPVTVDWPSVLAMAGIGAAVILAVTALSVPPLLRLMRPEGLRTE